MCLEGDETDQSVSVFIIPVSISLYLNTLYTPIITESQINKLCNQVGLFSFHFVAARLYWLNFFLIFLKIGMYNVCSCIS